MELEGRLTAAFSVYRYFSKAELLPFILFSGTLADTG